MSATPTSTHRSGTGNVEDRRVGLMSEIEAVLVTRKTGRPRPRRGAWLTRFIRKKPLGASSAAVLLGLLVWSLAAPLFGTTDPLAIDGRAALESPGSAHIFGTHNLGRDVYTRVAYGEIGRASCRERGCMLGVAED